MAVNYIYHDILIRSKLIENITEKYFLNINSHYFLYDQIFIKSDS